MSDVEYTYPLIFVSSEYMKLNSYNFESKSVCLKMADCISGKFIVDIPPLLEIDPSIFTCLLNTDDIDVRMYILNSVVQNYVHPNINDLLDILNLRDKHPPPYIYDQIYILHHYFTDYYHTNFSNFLLEKNEKFNVFSFRRDPSFGKPEYYYSKNNINFSDETTKSKYFEYASTILVHKSLIDFVNIHSFK